MERAHISRGARGGAEAAPGAPGEAHLRLDPLLAWLASPAVVREGGVVLSWDGPRGNGYPYPEAAALWLSLACGEPLARAAFAPAQVDAVAGWLCDEVDRHGAAARHGRRYVFDSGIALSALVAYEAGGGVVPVRATAQTLAGFVTQGVATRRAVLPVNVEPATHWSNAWSAHLVKAAMALHRWADHAGDAGAREAAAELVESVLPLWDGERFRVTEDGPLSYLHATLYGFEGLSWLTAQGLGAWGDVVARGAAFAAGLQTPAGGVPPFFDGAQAWGDPRADVAAQAVRLWVATDAAGWDAAIDRALSFLGGLQTPEGGVRYEASSADVNTWASLFAAQALLWRASGATVATLF